MENGKVTFLFGAGADHDACKNLPVGKDFIKVLLTSGNCEARKELLGEKNAQYSLITPNSINVYLQTIVEYRAEAIKVFGEKLVTKFSDYYQEKEVKEDRDSYREEVHATCKKWYCAITGNQPTSKSSKEVDVREISEDQKNFFLENAVFFDSLDGRFNALRHTDLDSRGKRVINAYTMIFVEMMKSRYNLGDDFEWTWEEVFGIFKKKENEMVKEEKKKTYYNILPTIKGNKENKEKDYYVATTNYTDIAETVIGEKPIYLHGNLSWFEDYERLIVYDCSNDDEREIALKRKSKIFPYIMIPSGVKPLICKKQIEEYNKFIDALNKSNKLCVVGYKFNKEDNHINSIIGEWLRHGDHKLYYYYFNEDKKTREEVIDALPTCIKDGNSSEESGNIEIDLIYNGDCHDKFEEFVSEHLLIG